MGWAHRRLTMDLAARCEQRFCGFQIGRLETLREPVIDRPQHRRRLYPIF